MVYMDHKPNENFEILLFDFPRYFNLMFSHIMKLLYREVTQVSSSGLQDESTYTWSTTIVGKELHDDIGTIYYLKNDKLIEKDEDPYFGSRTYTKIGDYDDIPPEKLIPQIGMTEQEVLDSKWGLPKRVNKTTTLYGVNEQWVYEHYKYIYLENGVVTAIQD
ncbi:hypothetical protein [Paenibacillus maysiensis]|uniref:hypothetical protein n=1 Tax=Paenibacillus maysiensis TaxID=1155954 RepID=UPI00046E5A3D|nr:hypothetical protein [Paenibacillus maysiensis]